MRRALQVWTVLAVLTALAFGEDRVSIKATPQALMAGGAVRVTCRVPRDPSNRGLTMGLPGYLDDFVQLDGEDSRITHERTYDHVPCEVDEARCVLVREDGRLTVARVPLRVECR